jgi:hypothetical protein
MKIGKSPYQDRMNEVERTLLIERFPQFVNTLKNIISKSGLFNKPYNEKEYYQSKNWVFGEKGMSISWKNQSEFEDFIFEGEVFSFKDNLDIPQNWNTLKIFIYTIRQYDDIEYYPVWIEPTFIYKETEYYCYSKNKFDFRFENFKISNNEFDIIKNIEEEIQKNIDLVTLEYENKLNKTKQKLGNIINDFDNDSDGQIDLVDGESFNKLLTKNQKNIIEIDKNYIQKFVKISMYIKSKKSNTQKIFESIKDIKSENELNELVNLLKNQIHTYELLVFHSINMITSLVESDLISFYEIYECFDQLGVFNSNWENEVSNKLTDIGDGIRDLMYSINQMENKIVSSIENLTYVTQDSFKELNMSVNNQLSGINSSIKFNNLLTGIQTYQMYRINQNTKGIN